MTSRDEHTYVLVAGELSGDVLGAGLIRALARRDPAARFAGVGGPAMQAAGLEAWYDLDVLSIMGLVEVLKHLPRLLHLRRELIQRTLAAKAVTFIGIDAPDFNLGLELRLRRAGIKTVHYVSPSVWAWRQGRVKGISRSVDTMLTLFPFEAAFYREHAVPVRFVGHPMADQIPYQWSKRDAESALTLEHGRRVALLPGSRVSEIDRLAPLYLDTARLLHKTHPDLDFVIPAATPRLAGWLRALVGGYTDLDVRITDGRAREAVAASDAVLVASGTATLETMLVGRPMVMAHRMAPLTAWLARRLVRTPYFALPNLLERDMLVPEYLQEAATPDALAGALSRLLDADHTALLQRFEHWHRALARNADEEAAAAVLALRNGRSHVAAG